MPRVRIVETLRRFEFTARDVIALHPALTLLPVPSLDRARIDGQEIWDVVPTVFSFLVDDPQTSEKPLALERARALHRWLNADLSPWIAGEPLAELLCHLGSRCPCRIRHWGARMPGLCVSVPGRVWFPVSRLMQV